MTAHESATSGYDGEAHFWRCRCGWEARVTVPPHAPIEQHRTAIDATYQAFKAHKAGAVA